MKGWRGRGQYDKNEETEFQYSMENVESQRIWMQSLEISIPAWGKQEGRVWARYCFIKVINIFLGH